MIRINLLAIERAQARKKRSIDAGQKLAIGCGAIIVCAGLYVGGQYWRLQRESSRLDAGIAAAKQESARLNTIIAQVRQFEQRRAQLQLRVTLIEQLRRNQAGPVQLLDEVSRALPTTLWLTQLKQVGGGVVIDGHCTSLVGLSDFVLNLEASGFFKRSIEIVGTTTETGPAGELIKFSIKADFLRPEEAPPAVPAPKAAGSLKPLG